MALPYGWTSSDVQQGIELARTFDAEPRDVFALWYHEGLLQPRIHPFGDYYGLIGGSDSLMSRILGYSWARVTQEGSISQQLDAIKKIWAVQQSALHESFASRAKKIGTTPAAMIYAMNFVPAYAAHMTDADGVLIAGSDPYYADNRVFDTNHKGYISIRDLENKIAAMSRQGAVTQPVSEIFKMVPIGARSSIIKAHPIFASFIVLGIAGAIAWYFHKHGGFHLPGFAHANPARKRRRGSSRVQSLLFSRRRFTPSSARAWARSHGYRAGKVDVTDQYIRLRQSPPSGFSRMRTKAFGQSGVKAVIGFR